MTEIKRFNGRPSIDYMARDYDSLLRSMRELIPQKLPEWDKFESEADFGNVLLQLFAHMGDILSYYQDRIANESFLGTARTRRSILHHLRLIGYKLATPAPASTRLQLTVPKAVNETITIHKGDTFATKSQKNQKSVRFEYTQDQPLIIDASDPDTMPVVGTSKRYAAGIPVEEGRLIKDEILGISNGALNQRFTLAHTGLILRSLGEAAQVNKDIVLTTELFGVIDLWTLQESLAFSRELRKDYVLDIDENDVATIVFGDDAFGAIPANGAVVKATYRVGGGFAGNVPAHSIQTIVNAPQLALLGAKVTNDNPATGGADRESIEHAVLQAPAVFRSLRRAVTAADYEALALRFPGVGKVRAEPTNWNTVTLFVAPAGGGDVSDVLEANLLVYFEDKRPISTIIEVEDVDYVQIYVTAQVGILSYYSTEEIKAKVQAIASDLLAFEKVNFAKPVYLSNFYDKIEDIEGVEFVNIIEFRREDQTTDTVEPSGKIELGSNEIPTVPKDLQYVAGLKVIASGGY